MNNYLFARPRAIKYKESLWIMDNESDICQICSANLKGSLFSTNKHHCYQCGIIICHTCISDIKLSRVNRLKNSPRVYGPTSSVQVCKNCGDQYKESKKIGKFQAPDLNINKIFDSYVAEGIHDAGKLGFQSNPQYFSPSDIAIREGQRRDISFTKAAYFSPLLSCAAVILWDNVNDKIVLYHAVGSNLSAIKLEFNNDDYRVIVMSALPKDELNNNPYASLNQTIKFPLEKIGIDKNNIRIFANATGLLSIHSAEIGVYSMPTCS